MLLTLGALIVVLGVLIFVHEAGHFLAAKAMGIQVIRFSLGFGRPLVSFQRGETEYAISWLPVGGYVKMAGMEEEGLAGELEGGKTAVPIDPERAFDRKPVWKRIIVIIAGVTANFIFAFVVYSALAYGGALEPDRLATTRVDSVQTSELPAAAAVLGTLHRGDRIVAVNDDSVVTWGELLEKLVTTPGPVRVSVEGRPDPLVFELPANDSVGRLALARSLNVYLPPVVAEVQPGGAGDRAGLKPNDRILKVDRDTVRSWNDFALAVKRRPGEPVAIMVERAGSPITLSVTPERRTEIDPETKQLRTYGLVGVVAEHPVLKAPTAFGAIRLGWRETMSKVGLIVQFLRRPKVQDLGGPLTIGQVSGQAARVGLGFFLGFMAFLSINLAVLNLLPIPILDGGQLVFLLVEALRRRPLSIQLRARLTQLGFVVLLGIMLLALRNDVMRVFPHVFSR